jgi:hypothetical protein
VLLLLVGKLALIPPAVGIVATSERVGLAGPGLQLALEVGGLALLASPVLL